MLPSTTVYTGTADAFAMRAPASGARKSRPVASRPNGPSSTTVPVDRAATRARTSSIVGTIM